MYEGSRKRIIVIVFVFIIIPLKITFSKYSGPIFRNITSYNPDNSYDYAEKYAFKVCSDGYFFENSYPPSYLGAGAVVPSATGYDCAHYVSCCIGSEANETGGGLNVPSRTEAYGEPGAERLGNWLLSSNIGKEVSSIGEMVKGDVVNYDWDGDGDWDHAAIYLGDYKVGAHSNSVWEVSWDLGGASSYRFIHIIVGSQLPIISISQHLGVYATRTNPSTIFSLPNEYSGTPPDPEKNIVARFKLRNNGTQYVTLDDYGVMISKDGNDLFRLEKNASSTLASGQEIPLFDIRGYITDRWTSNQTKEFKGQIQYQIDGSWINVTGSGNYAHFMVYSRPSLQNGMIIKRSNNPDVYYYQNGFKWKISNENAAEYLNPSWQTELYVYLQSDLNRQDPPLSPSHNSTTPQIIGRNLLYKSNNNPDVYIIEPEPGTNSPLRSRKFNDENAFYNYGYPSGALTKQIVTVGSSMYNWIQRKYPVGSTIYVSLNYVSISGPDQVNESSNADYTCTAHYSDGSTQNVTYAASWSENSVYALISSSGTLNTSSVSSDVSCTITASYGGKSATKNITIKNVTATLNSLSISGPNQVNENSSADYTCTAHYSDGSTQNVTYSASWSENSVYALINSSGLLTTSSVSSDRSCTITASYGGKSATKNITIKNVTATLNYIAPKITYSLIPLIDGNLNDPIWSFIGEQSLLYGGGPWNTVWTSFDDNLVTWKAGWCKETNKLYLAVNVIDDVRGRADNGPFSSNYHPYLDDCIEFFTDGNHSGGPYYPGYKQAQHWLVTYENYLCLWDYPDPNGHLYNKNDINTSVKLGTNGNWTFEAEMIIYNQYPGSVKLLKEGDIMGWNIWYSDSDNVTFKNGYYDRDHQTGWYYVGPASSSASYFGDLILGTEISTGSLSLNLNKGWNMFSINVILPDLDIAIIFATISSQLKIIKNDQGQIYDPFYGINQIGNIDYKEGYQAYLTDAATLNIIGQLVDPTTPIPLPSGWSITSYLPSVNIDIERALASINGQLIIAKNNNGQIYHPTYNINQIGQMEPGQGYQVYMEYTGTLIYPANSMLPSLSKNNDTRLLPQIEHFQFTSNTGDNATIILPTAANPQYSDGTSVENGDEIGVFTSAGLCCGAIAWEGQTTAITVWGDNSQTQESDGFTAGDVYHFRVWNNSTNTEYLATVQFETGPQSVYGTNNYSVVTDLIVDISVNIDHENEILPLAFKLYDNYPNPFNPETTIHFSLPKTGHVTLSIYNVSGQHIETLISEDRPAGEYKFVWRANGVLSGIYLYRLVVGNYVETKKLILQR